MTDRELETMIITIVNRQINDSLSEIRESLHSIRNHQCPIPEAVQNDIGSLVGVIQDLGGGSMHDGINVIRAHHKFIKGIINTTSKLTSIISASIVVTLVTGMLALIGFAIKEAIKVLVKGG